MNEALNDDATYRTSVFYNTMGTSYIPIAFAAAAAADPAAKLYCQYLRASQAACCFTKLVFIHVLPQSRMTHLRPEDHSLKLHNADSKTKQTTTTTSNTQEQRPRQPSA